MDLKDRKIIYELYKDARQSNKKIAKKVNLTEQSVGNRIRRLKERKILEYFFVKTNPGLLGYMHLKIYLRTHNLTKNKEKELIEELKKEKNIFWVVSLRGKYDLVVSIYVKNIADFTERYDKIFNKWGEYILERNALIMEKGLTYTLAYLLPDQEHKLIPYSHKTQEILKLDKINHNLLQLLNTNGRLSLIELSKKLNLSPDAIKYRIKNLKEKEIITGFGVKINYELMDNSYYIILLKFQNMNSSKYKKLEQIAKQNKNLYVFIKTIGDHDIELETITNNKKELDELINSLKNNFVSEIKNYEILEMTREHRITYYPF